MFILLTLPVAALPWENPFSNIFGDQAATPPDSCAASDIATTALFPLTGMVAPNDISYDQEMADLLRINAQTVDVRKTVFGNDFINPSWLTVFTMHSGIAYCPTSDPALLSNFGKPNAKLPQGLPLGNFAVDSVNEFDQYSGLFGKILGVFQTKPDGKFIISVSDDQKLIVLSWRGSKSLQDFAADFDSEQLPLSSPLMTSFLDTKTITNPKCKLPTDTSDMFLFAGFAKTMQQDIMTNHVLPKLVDIQSRHPTYSLILNGHSLGAVKAFITAFYLSKFNPDITFKAIYSFEQPLIGSTKLSTFMADCIGPEKIIRVVSSNDIVPWMRFTSNIQHPPTIKEIFNIDSDNNQFKVCLGSGDSTCSAKYKCGERNWDHHSKIGGVALGGLCQYIGLQDEKSLLDKVKSWF